MLIPAGIFAALNVGRASIAGWGIPMATDIAFAVGVLTLLGSRVPPALQMLGIRSPWAYVAPAAAAWAGAYAAGFHPTLAGVAVGLMTPVRAWFGRKKFFERADASVAALREHGDADERELLAHLDHLDEARREAVSPVERIQHALHGWVAFGAMPLFALANAGVSLGDASFAGESLLVFAGVGLGLIVGKPVGILAFSWLATRFGIAALPRGVTWPQVGVVGVVAGIGFTMSIFIAALAFPVGTNLETAKVGILIGSGIAAVIAYGLGRIVLPSSAAAGAAATAAEAEASTAS